MFCKNCGNKLSSNDRVCPVCGHLPGEVVVGGKQKNPTQVLLVLVLVTLIMALVVVSLLIVYKINKTPEPSETKVVIVTPTPSPTADATPTPTPTESPTPSPSPTPTPTPTATPTPTPASTPTPEPSSSREIVSYSTYTDRNYGFKSAYPSNFHSVAPSGVNAVKTYVSADSTATMTLRATYNTGGMSVQDALDDLYAQYGSDVNYQQHGETWYAAAVTRAGGARSLYRKLFVKNGIICCMDFEYNISDYDIYQPCLEDLENNFTTNID